MKVVNLDDTSDNTCKCENWLEHWKKFSSQSLPNYCPVISCMNKIDVGAHVRKYSSFDKEQYIIPLCKGCNAKKGEAINIADNTILVPANIQKTCGK